MSAQIAGHQKVLDTINDRLLPAVKNDRLADYVKDIKPTVESHLKEARDIEQSLGTDKQAGATGGTGNRTGAGAGTGTGMGTATGTGTRNGRGPATP